MEQNKQNELPINPMEAILTTYCSGWTPLGENHPLVQFIDASDLDIESNYGDGMIYGFVIIKRGVTPAMMFEELISLINHDMHCEDDTIFDDIPDAIQMAMQWATYQGEEVFNTFKQDLLDNETIKSYEEMMLNIEGANFNPIDDLIRQLSYTDYIDQIIDIHQAYINNLDNL